MTTSSRHERLIHFVRPGHVLAWMLILIPLSGAVLSVMLPGEDVARRIRAAAQLIDAMLFPALGLFLGIILAAYFHQRVLSHLYAVTSAVLGAVLLLLAPLFLLDSLQIRNAVELRRLYDLNTGRALVEHLLYGTLLLLLAIAAWRNLRANRPPAASAPNVFGASGPSARTTGNKGP